MRHFTHQQRIFIAAYARTGNGNQSAIEAGYAPADARSRASKLLSRPDIQAEVERQRQVGSTGQPSALDHQYDGPLEFLRAVMSDPGADPRLRIEAAKALLPYVHAKKGEMGKKDAAKEAAKAAAQGRYRLRHSPPLKSVK